jgi:uncharacterized membrane protein
MPDARVCPSFALLSDNVPAKLPSGRIVAGVGFVPLVKVTGYFVSRAMTSLQHIAKLLRRRGPRETLFLLSIGLKGFDSLLELIGGIALFAVSPMRILQVVRFLTQDEIAEDPRDLVANALRHAAGHLTFATEHFMAIYLLVHGAVKLVMVWALLARVLAAYPVAMVIFAGFIIYQLYRYTFTHGAGLLALSMFDIAVIALIFLEYRALRHDRA